MGMLANILVGFVAMEHLGFLTLEMFLWKHPIGLKVFRQTLEQAQATAAMGANQGLYNGFLAAGLLWSLLHPSAEFSHQLKIFFLACVIVAGLYGAYSVSGRILIVQALPAAVALALVMMG